jgi:hypothetical protein
MVSIDTFRKTALSFEGTEEKPHFDRVAFKVVGQRIFATIKENDHTANMKISINDQAIYCSFNPKTVYAVPNKFGLQGWTTFELENLPFELVSDALLTAYNDVINSTKKSKINR